MNCFFKDIDCRDILNAVSDPLHIIDTEGILVFANTAWEEMIGISLAEAKGLHINEAIEKSNSGFYFSFEKDEDTQTTQYTHFDHKNFDSVALTALKRQKPISMFAYLREHQRVLLTSSPLFHSGQIRYALTICRNLTDFSTLCEELENAIEKNKLIMDELEFYRNSMVSSQNIIGKSPAVQGLLQSVQYVAATDATVLITGESGVGKEVLTNEIHRLSKRTGEPFIRVNCASIPESLIESELFGYEKGAFTGAVKNKPGMFELANGGTLLLDEIGELPKALQPKLLRVLQEREIMRVGGTKTIPVDVRLIAATNQDLAAMVRRGEFRQDLYYRLNLIPLRIPPLRERAEDIPPAGTALFGRVQRKIRQKEAGDGHCHADAEALPMAGQYPGAGKSFRAAGHYRRRDPHHLQPDFKDSDRPGAGRLSRGGSLRPWPERADGKL